MRISDWSSDVCTSDLKPVFDQLLEQRAGIHLGALGTILRRHQIPGRALAHRLHEGVGDQHAVMQVQRLAVEVVAGLADFEELLVFGMRDVAIASSAARRVGAEGVSTCRSRWESVRETKNNNYVKKIK